MCKGDDQNCPDFELHRKKLLDELDNERRSFLKSAFVVTGGAAALVAGGTFSRAGPIITMFRPWPTRFIGVTSASC